MHTGQSEYAGGFRDAVMLVLPGRIGERGTLAISTTFIRITTTGRKSFARVNLASIVSQAMSCIVCYTLLLLNRSLATKDRWIGNALKSYCEPTFLMLWYIGLVFARLFRLSGVILFVALHRC